MRIHSNIIFTIILLACFYSAVAQPNSDTTYYTDGEIESIGIIVDGEKEGKWIWYHPNGEICGKEIYKYGRLKKSKYWDESGKKSDASEVRTNPEYPGGLDAFLDLIESNLVYPEQLASEGIKGRTILQFNIDTLGNVGTPIVVKSSHPDLDKEAIRVVLLSKPWKPATFHGELHSAIMTFPVNFELE